MWIRQVYFICVVNKQICTRQVYALVIPTDETRYSLSLGRPRVLISSGRGVWRETFNLKSVLQQYFGKESAKSLIRLRTWGLTKQEKEKLLITKWRLMSKIRGRVHENGDSRIRRKNEEIYHLMLQPTILQRRKAEIYVLGRLPAHMSEERLAKKATVGKPNIRNSWWQLLCWMDNLLKDPTVLSLDDS